MTSAVWWWLRSPNYNNNNNFCNVNNNGNNNNNNAYYSAGVRPGFCDCEVKWSNRNPAFGFQVKDDLRKRRDTSPVKAENCPAWESGMGHNLF